MKSELINLLQLSDDSEQGLVTKLYRKITEQELLIADLYRQLKEKYQECRELDDEVEVERKARQETIALVIKMFLYINAGRLLNGQDLLYPDVITDRGFYPEYFENLFQEIYSRGITTQIGLLQEGSFFWRDVEKNVLNKFRYLVANDTCEDNPYSCRLVPMMQFQYRFFVKTALENVLFWVPDALEALTEKKPGT